MSTGKRAREEELSSSDSAAKKKWVKCFSKTYNRDYWFNSADGSRSWEEPPAVELQKDENVAKSTPVEAVNEQPVVKVAIIVPFRDLTAEKTRMKQLRRFVPQMVNFLRSSKVAFHVYIIEQSNDRRKFNRGKLLNIGFDIAVKEGCTIFIFHDVDLLPSTELLDYYTQQPTVHPIHIARVWDRYNANPSYFGGVVSFSKDMFVSINGFPNNFWGWGGEDDEMYKRVVKVGLKPIAPKAGSLEDMEDMDLGRKLDFLRTNKVLKCMNKHEVLEEHATTWQRNGLADLRYEETGRERLDADGFASKITVDVRLNKHWTDNRCGIDDTQL